MISAVHLAMTIGAILRGYEPASTPRGVTEINHAPCVRVAAATNLGMAGLTELRALLDQHGWVIRSMNLVAKCAFLRSRRVLPQERAAFFGMAGIAVVIDAQLLQGCISYGAMRIVAITTDDLSFANRVAEGPE